jgi:LPXTG-motif cell wall-anchored protein
MAKRIRQAVIGGALGGLVLCAGTAAASDYPPGGPTVTTVATSGASGVADPADPAVDPAVDPAKPSALANTGSNSDATMKIAGGAVVAGAGLLVAARLRRRPAAT